MATIKFLTKARIPNIANHKTDHQGLRPQLTAALSIKPIHSSYHLGSKSIPAHRLHYTLATCRGFCCSAPPCSLKPHGDPPERETTISSATIAALSSQPAVCVCVCVCEWGCLGCSALLQFLTRISQVSMSVRLRSPTPLRDHGKSLHPWGDRGWLAFICLHWNAVSEGGQSVGVCVCVCACVCVHPPSYSTLAMSLSSTLYRRGCLLICPPKITTSTTPSLTLSSAGLASSHGSQICLQFHFTVCTV